MKKSLVTLIFCLFLSLGFCHAGLADSCGVGVSNDVPLLRQWEKSPCLSAFLLLDDEDIAFVHFPFTRTAHTIAFQNLTAFFSSVNAVLSARDLLWTGISKWNPTPYFSWTQRHEAVADTSRRAFYANNDTAEDRMAICLHHGAANRKEWNVSLDFGITIQNDYAFVPGDAISDGLFPKLGMDLETQSDGIFDQIRSTAPFIGIGISCRF